MALVFERIQTEGIAELSYLLGDDSDGVAAVFDPTPDVDKYVQLARERRVSITHIFETHIHADLVSGARELRDRVGSAKIFVSHEGDARYGFDHEPVMDGDTFAFGKAVVTVRHTPGHTSEHVSYAVAARDRPQIPWGVLTGDSLFVNSVGRPDLMGSSQTDDLVQMLFQTLYGYFLALPDSVVIHPAHGHGSPCGADIGDRMQSTIGYERRFNPFLQHADLESFKAHALGTAPPAPTYYPRMKTLNARGPEVLGRLPCVPGLPATTFDKAVQHKAGVLVDTRMMLAYGGGHVRGALNLGASPTLSIWAGWLLDPNEPILLVLDHDDDLDELLPLFIRTGFTKFAGFLVGGMEAWSNAGLPLEAVAQLTVHDVHEAGSDLLVLDVRAPSEWSQGHVPGARHVFLPNLRSQCHELDENRPIAVYCDSGYRASIATSILNQEGIARVRNVPGSWQAWIKAGLPVEVGGRGA